jgi:hypothetical protein
MAMAMVCAFAMEAVAVGMACIAIGVACTSPGLEMYMGAQLLTGGGIEGAMQFERDNEQRRTMK